MNSNKKIIVSSLIFLAIFLIQGLSNAEMETAKEKDVNCLMHSQELCPKEQIFKFVKKFPMEAKARVDIPRTFGGNSIDIQGKGFMKFYFSPTEDPRLLYMSLKDIRLNVEPFSIGEMKVGEFSISLGNFQHQKSHGILNVETGEVSFTFVLVLSPEIIPELEKFGFHSEQVIKITEKGKMDIRTGMFETHAEPFDLPGGLKVFGGQFGGGCGTSVDLYINVLHSSFGNPRRHIEEVWICRGDTVRLMWESSDDVSNCDLAPGIGNVHADGHNDVSPSSDTTYTITAHGDCDENDSVEVHVVNEGDEYTIVAQPDYRTGVWYLNIPREICSPNIIITSIRPAACSWGAGVWLAWACQKIDPDGTTRLFNINGRTSPGDIPLPGDWSFVPQGVSYIPQGPACFIVTLKCQ